MRGAMSFLRVWRCHLYGLERVGRMSLSRERIVALVERFGKCLNLVTRKRWLNLEPKIQKRWTRKSVAHKVDINGG